MKGTTHPVRRVRQAPTASGSTLPSVLKARRRQQQHRLSVHKIARRVQSQLKKLKDSMSSDARKSLDRDLLVYFSTGTEPEWVSQAQKRGMPGRQFWDNLCQLCQMGVYLLPQQINILSLCNEKKKGTLWGVCAALTDIVETQEAMMRGREYVRCVRDYRKAVMMMEMMGMIDGAVSDCMDRVVAGPRALTFSGALEWTSAAVVCAER